MAFRFFRRKRIAPGVSLNLSKRGASLSFGPRGAKATIGTRGARGTLGIPGTGLRYTKQVTSRGAKGDTQEEQATRPGSHLSLGFLRRLFTPKPERAFVDGVKALMEKNPEEAEQQLKQCPELTDAAFLMGMTALQRGATEEGIQQLTRVYRERERLGDYFTKYGVSPSFPLGITEDISTFVEPDDRGVLLVLLLAFQDARHREDAMKCAQTLHKMAHDDLAVRLATAEFLAQTPNPSQQTWQDIVKLTESLDNESEVHAALLYCRARALRELGLLEAAKDTLTTVLRRTKDRPDELLRKARYLRAQVYEGLGNKSKARKEFERIYAEASDFEDVAQRLGLR